MTSPASAFVALVDTDQLCVFFDVVPDKTHWRDKNKMPRSDGCYKQAELDVPYSLPLDQAPLFDIIVAKTNLLNDQVDRVVAAEKAVQPSLAGAAEGPQHLFMVYDLVWTGEDERLGHMVAVTNPPLGLWGQLGARGGSILPFWQHVAPSDIEATPLVQRAVKLLHTRRQQFVDALLAAPAASQARAGTPVHVVSIGETSDYSELCDDDCEQLGWHEDLGDASNASELLGYYMASHR